MDTEHKKQLRAAYKLAPTYYGVIQIKNRRNQKIFIDTAANLHNRWHFYQLNLDKNFYRDTPLQLDWNSQAPTDFDYTVLWQAETADVTNMRQTLKTLKLKWLAKLKPFDDQGYNRRPKDWEDVQHDD
ncbi:GIY-YIG nuclease family protein [Lactiplantibacillus dongliensis]|uniref:GIY-YIG nuclease family protein n=1 Tax=Lactiplantibacillus dongliensis TaxID=2559919 RepID=A0ABW1R9X6_9LACO|nr:GIY-YIG nuclease family protein [Lactiplantibacillus dongliensis]